MELVLVYSDTQSFEPLQSILPVSLISIMGKPLLQHQLEVAYSQSINQCTIIASDNLWKIRNFCEDGQRFGVRIKLVTAAPSGDEMESLLRHRHLLGETCLILAGRTLARLPVAELRRQHDESNRRISVIRHRDTNEIVGVLTSPPSPVELFQDMTGSIQNVAATLLQTHPDDVNVIEMSFPCIVSRSIKDVLKLTATVLETPADYIHNTHFAQQDSGVYLGHHTAIHRSVKLNPPVAIGDFCQILEDAEIGPHATISSGSIISKGAIVKNAVISPDSYVGEGMSVKDAIVSGATLVQPLTGTKVLVSDPLLLDSIHGQSLTQIANTMVQRAAALGLLTALFPVGVSVAAISKLKTNRALARTQTVGHGDVEDQSDLGWLPRFNRFEIADKSLPFFWYPTLYNVAKGQMCFTGPGPMDSAAAQADSILPNTERYKVPPGLFPVDSLFESADSAEVALAEVMYTRKKGLIQDLRCVAANLTKNIIGKQNARRLAGL
ncbi:MAG: NDP-sugar synthase [Deltaproteobacteria bacterium]|nr:NDP-sugar synthase [Deltaproteobacteria bacterium]